MLQNAAGALLVCYTVSVELVTLTLHTLNNTNIMNSLADKFSLLIAKLDDAFSKEEELIKEHIAKCKELIAELDSIECAE